MPLGTRHQAAQLRARSRGWGAARPPALTSQSVLQAQVDEARGDLQQQHREHGEEDQHAGVDPVEGVWKAEGALQPRPRTDPEALAQPQGEAGLLPGRLPAGEARLTEFRNQLRDLGQVLTAHRAGVGGLGGARG